MPFPTPAVTTTTADDFIPEIWSDEIKASYEQNLVLAALIKKMSMKGKKGDTIHVPIPDRGAASAKAAETAVTVIAGNTSDLPISIDQHWEYSRHIEDIVSVQALSSLRQFYTQDAGYALATQLDDYLFDLGTNLGDAGGGTAATPANWVGSNTIRANGASDWEAWAEDTQAAGDLFNDVVMRQGLQILDDANVPMMNRFFVIPPVGANLIRGIDRYNSQDFVNNKGVANGQIGEVYGVPVYVSTNVPTIETSAQNASGTTESRAALLAHKDVYVCAEQMGVRSQTQYQQEYLADLFTADRLYGARDYRTENGVNIVFSA